ncbi:MAG TPA: plastocyanin/azurin family copper-binding protein [Solirubrobacterales bacterium]|nr:plastocyanin/azurin family copper-binding protein [Solirubrobacterales bacterium]
MSNGDLFYICGIGLAISAVVISFLGLRVKSFPGKAAPLVALWFVLLVGASATFSVLHAQDEEAAKAAEFESANEEITEEEASPVEPEGEKAPATEPEPAAEGPGDTLQLAASPTDIAYDTTSLTSKPGKVTIDFDNPAALEHDVAIEQDGKEIAASETISKGTTSVTADLAPGTYTFLCTVPGHAEAGMQGVLTVR